MHRKRPHQPYIKFVVYLVAVVMLNAAGLTLFFRIDLTGNRVYSLSEASKQVVSTLSEPLTLKVFFTNNLPAPYNTIERYLRDLLEEYAVHANRHFNYRFYNVSPETEGVTPPAQENQKLAGNYGIRPVQIQAIEKDEVKIKKAYMGLVLIHGDMIERLATITSVNGLEYRLTTAIQKLNNKISALLSLTDRVGVKLFLSSSLMQVAPFMGVQALNDYPQQLEGIVKALNAQMYGKLAYTYLDPSRDPEAARIAETYNLMRLKWPAIPERNLTAGNGVVGVVMEYGGRFREIPVLNAIRIPIIGTQYELLPADWLEEIINENLETLININEDMGYLTGHGALEFSGPGRQNPEALTVFPNLVSQNYTLKPVHLKDKPVPLGLKTIIIARPTEPFNDYELYQIDQALMRGTNLAIFLDAFTEQQPQAQQPFGVNPGADYAPLDTGLEKLLTHYGVQIQRAIVMDRHSHKELLPPQMGGGEVLIYYAPIIKNRNINKTLNFMRHIKGLVAIKMSPLQLDEARLSTHNLKAHLLFSSSEESWPMQDRINLNPMFLSAPPPDTAFQSYALAYLLEGAFPSYFEDRPMPERPPAPEKKPDESASTGSAQPTPGGEAAVIEKEGGFLAKGKPAKVFLTASSDMLKDNILDPEGKTPNALFVLNVLDALNDRENIALMRSKELTFNPLRETGAWVKTAIKTVNVAGLPAAVILFGALIWWRRSIRKRQIQMMFGKTGQIV